ncbi:MAG: response regulator, partial [bacterium]|nr:response regulator [bacterium]
MPLEKIDYKDYPILYVDDESDNLEIWALNLADTFTVLTASSGEEGLAILNGAPVALVISDQRMPGMTGMEFLREVRKHHPQMVLILVTAYADLDVLAEGMNAGLLYAYLLKPWESKELRMVLGRGIEHYYLRAERDRLHRDQIDTVKKMARTNKLTAVGTLAAGIAHEIRNPLVSIQTFLEMVPPKLAELPLADPASLDREFWEDFHRLSYSEIQRIRTLITELVNLARATPTTLKEEDLGPMVAAMVALVRKEADKRGVTVVYQRGSTPLLLLDAGKIKQVLLNILLNALQATPPGGRIEVTAPDAGGEEKKGFFRLSVRDTGEGIPDEIQEQVLILSSRPRRRARASAWDSPSVIRLWRSTGGRSRFEAV